MSAKSQDNTGFPLSDEQVTDLTNWVQLVQMQEDLVTEKDTREAIKGIMDAD